MTTDSERLESDREWREAISPGVIELCAVCLRERRQCECAAQGGQASGGGSAAGRGSDGTNRDGRVIEPACQRSVERDAGAPAATWPGGARAHRGRLRGGRGCRRITHG